MLLRLKMRNHYGHLTVIFPYREKFNWILFVNLPIKKIHESIQLDLDTVYSDGWDNFPSRYSLTPETMISV